MNLFRQLVDSLDGRIS